MNTYAKLINGQLETLRNVPHISNPTEEMVKEYAEANGYKSYLRVPMPADGGYYHHGYKETKAQIKDVWTPYSDSEMAPIHAREAHAYLDSTDWVAAKLAEVDGEERTAMLAYYADTLAKRREARETINKFEN